MPHRLRVERAHLVEGLLVGEGVVVVGVRPRVEVARLDVVHEAQLVVGVAVDVVEPRRELDRLDVERDADVREHRREQRREVGRIGVGDRQLEREVVDARLLEEVAGGVGVEGDRVGQVLVAGVEDRNGAILRLAGADALEDRVVVDRESERLPYTDVVERLGLFVEGEDELVGRLALREFERPVELRGEIGLDGGEDVEGSVESGCDERRRLGDVGEDDLGDARRIPPVVVVAREREAVALTPRLEHEGARAVRRRLHVGGVVRVEDEPGRPGQEEEEVLVRLRQRDLHRALVGRGDLFDRLQAREADHRLVGAGLVERGDDVLCRELGAVVEGDARLEGEGIGAAVVGDRPVARQGRHDLAVLGA